MTGRVPRAEQRRDSQGHDQTNAPRKHPPQQADEHLGVRLRLILRVGGSKLPQDLLQSLVIEVVLGPLRVCGGMSHELCVGNGAHGVDRRAWETCAAGSSHLFAEFHRREPQPKARGRSGLDAAPVVERKLSYCRRRQVLCLPARGRLYIVASTGERHHCLKKFLYR